MGENVLIYTGKDVRYDIMENTNPSVSLVPYTSIVIVSNVTLICLLLQNLPPDEFSFRDIKDTFVN